MHTHTIHINKLDIKQQLSKNDTIKHLKEWIFLTDSYFFAKIKTTNEL